MGIEGKQKQMSGTQGAVARGVAWMLLARIADRLGGIVSIGIVARYLSPSDFGIFQMALSVLIIVELLAVFAFDWALIRHPDPKREHFDTAFTLQLLIAIAVGLLVLALAHPFAAYFRTPALVEPVMLLAFAPLVSASNNLAVAHLRREMKFELDFWRMTLGRLIHIVVGIALAIILQSYWALIIGSLVARGASNGVGFFLHPYRPRLDLSKWRELLGYSMWVQSAALVEGLKSRLSDLIVGRQLGPHSLAVYNMSNELAALPQAEFVGAVNTAVFSKYSRVQDDRAQLRQLYLEVVALTFLTGLPIACGLGFVAPGLVRLLLGPGWSAVADIVPVVAFATFANALAVNSGYVLMATGKLWLQTCMSAISIALLLPLLLIVTDSHGILGAAWVFTAVSYALLPVHLTVMGFVIGLRVPELAGRIWRPLVSAAAMCICLVGFPTLPASPTISQAIANVILLAAVGATVYLVTVWALWLASGRPASVERMVIGVALDIFSRTRSRLTGR